MAVALVRLYTAVTVANSVDVALDGSNRIQNADAAVQLI
jgi:hypothetical protein